MTGIGKVLVPVLSSGPIQRLGTNHGTIWFTELLRSLSILSLCLISLRTITTTIIKIIVCLTNPMNFYGLISSTTSYLTEHQPNFHLHRLFLFFVLHISFFERCIRFLIFLHSAHACPWAYKPDFSSLYTLFKFSLRHINQNIHLSILCSDLPLGIQTIILSTRFRRRWTWLRL